MNNKSESQEADSLNNHYFFLFWESMSHKVNLRWFLSLLFDEKVNSQRVDVHFSAARRVVFDN